jgi:hypothetical protein
MRTQVSKDILDNFFKEFAKSFRTECNVYILGGASAIFYGWRVSTHDIDLKVIPDSEAYKVISSLKDRMSLNIELASPDNFIPALPGWQDRSEFIVRHGKVNYYHYDFYAQALSKLERAFERDIADVDEMISAKLIQLDRLMSLFEEIELDLVKFPAIDPKTFRSVVEDFISSKRSV